MRITNGERELLEAGSFIAEGGGKETKIVIEKGTESVTVLLNLQTAEKGPPTVMVETPAVNVLKLNLTNWNQAPLGAAWGDKPVPIGTFAGRRLYLAMHARKSGTLGDQYLINVTFYLGEEVTVGGHH